MTEVCPICQASRRPGSAFCEKCGYHYEDKYCPSCNKLIAPGAVFCDQCGYKMTETTFVIQDENEVTLPSAPHPEIQMAILERNIKNDVQKNSNPKDHENPKKTSRGIIIGIAAAAVIIIIGVVVFIYIRNKPASTTVPAAKTTDVVQKQITAPKYSYEVPKTIHPALYQCTDYVVYFKGSSEVGKEMLLTVEIPGFTQKYEQKVVLQPQELKMKVRPPMIEGVLNTLNKSKEAQIKVTLQDESTQKYLIQDSKPLTLLSKYDMKWVKEDGSETYYENICAWVTPEDPKIKELLRNSINQLAKWTKNQINAMVGYQPIGGLNNYDVTYYQIAAIYETLRSYYQVRYNATPFSTSGSEAQQRIALPKDVINQKSGLCIETVVTMASAIEATGMHPMLLILPGHAQVAVEDWSHSGEYYIVETTALTEPNWDNVIRYLDKQQWNDYLNKNKAVVIDLELARKDGIKPME